MEPKAETSKKERGESILKMILSSDSKFTRESIGCDLRMLFGKDYTPEVIADFAEQSKAEHMLALNKFKNDMTSKGLAPATVRRRLVTLKRIINIAYDFEYINHDSLRLVKLPAPVPKNKPEPLTFENVRDMMLSEKRNSISHNKSRAILRLLAENGLRRNEIATLRKIDFDPVNQTLNIMGKGSHGRRTLIHISRKAAEAILDYMKFAKYESDDEPLFHTSGRYIYDRIRTMGRKAGFYARPHLLRHAAITAVANEYNGDLLKILEFSRQKTVKTLYQYIDNKENHQVACVEILSNLF